MTAKRPEYAHLQQIIKRGVAEIIVEREFVDLLNSGRSLRLKQGFDPSAPDIHLGHMVGLRKLRQLQDLGHTVVLIVGDWTAQIGDPSGRSATRPMLTAEQVAENAQSYLQQFFKVVDPKKTEVRRQTEWFDGFDLSDVIRLTRRFTVAQILKRDDFAKRFQENQPIAVTEMLYPLLQAYDSVMVQADVEFGGTDQRFNNLLGRELQVQVGQRPQQVFLVPLLVGTDGAQKMSKSLGNYIGIAEPPEQMYGKTMSIPDSLILRYFELLTDVPQQELDEYAAALEAGPANPMELKKRLAEALVRQFHGDDATSKAAEHFRRVVQEKERPEDVPSLLVPFSRASGVGGGGDAVGAGSDLIASADGDGVKVHIARVLVRAGLTPTTGEARRLLAQGAVRVDGRKLGADEMIVRAAPESMVQVGARRFVRLVDAG